MEILPYLNIPATEEYTDEELAEHGITREEAEAGRITETETPETDVYKRQVLNCLMSRKLV